MPLTNAQKQAAYAKRRKAKIDRYEAALHEIAACGLTGPADVARIALGADQNNTSDIEWFGSHTNLELFFYMPTYGDDEDISEEWRVTSVNGGVNDREWTVIGRGKTPAEALAAARKQKEN